MDVVGLRQAVLEKEAVNFGWIGVESVDCDDWGVLNRASATARITATQGQADTSGRRSVRVEATRRLRARLQLQWYGLRNAMRASLAPAEFGSSAQRSMITGIESQWTRREIRRNITRLKFMD